VVLRNYSLAVVRRCESTVGLTIFFFTISESTNSTESFAAFRGLRVEGTGGQARSSSVMSKLRMEHAV